MTTNNKTLSAEQRRLLTIKTVIELAAEQNPNEISTTAIAKRMGVTQGALFRHFPNKETILEAVMKWTAERLLTRIDKATQSISSPSEALKAIFMTHIDFVAQHPGIPRMLFGELQHSNDSLPKRMVKILIQQYHQRIEGWFLEGIKQGEFKSELDTQAAALLFIGSIQGLVIHSLMHDQPKSIQKQAPAIWALYYASLIGGDHA